MVDAGHVQDVYPVLLSPRPFATSSGRLTLLPLLPERHPTKPLPNEIWAKILGFVFAQYTAHKQQQSHESISRLKLGLLLVCRTLKARMISPVMFEAG